MGVLQARFYYSYILRITGQKQNGDYFAKIASAFMRGILPCHRKPSWVGQEAEKLRVGVC